MVEPGVPSDLLVIGLGYVGLPLAREAALSGLKVAGFDLSPAVVTTLNSGRSHVGDVTDADVAKMLDGGFRATARAEDIDGADTVVICVPTPLTADNGPDLQAVRAATEMTGRMLGPGMLVVLESTTYPGTTDEVVCPILEKASGLTAGLDFSLAFSPERIDPGNEHYGIRNTPKVVGGHTTSCTDAAAAFYGKLCDQVVRARSAREAEMAKLLENTYRHVNIALVNEMSAFCHELGIDLWDSIRCAATKPFGFQAFYPGPGVGGHCIPIDPNYLGYKVRTLGYPFRFVELAQEINGRMPAQVADRAAEVLNLDSKAMRGARILLLGVTYKRDVADQRESPAAVLGAKLGRRGADLAYHDPHVGAWSPGGTAVRRATDLRAEVSGADLVILLQDHSGYDLDDISRRARRILDTRGRLAGPNVERL
jgi:UDP-N-acetyl-D-glucosamine dehydrogenase